MTSAPGVAATDRAAAQPVDEHDARLALRATGVLRELNQRGVLDAADVHTATRLGALAGESEESVLLALAVVVRSLSRGSVCVDLAEVAAISPGFAWPDPAGWRHAVLHSALVERQVLRWDHDLLYLDRYWQQEVQLAADLQRRTGPAGGSTAPEPLARALDRLFPDPAHAEQRVAALMAATRPLCVITGGPGTGKTSTIAAVLAVLLDDAEGADGADGARRAPRIALAAPTGKAAARLQEAIQESATFLPDADRERVGSPTASTLHRLLGTRPDNPTRFRHHRGNRLPHDVVVVDEASMVDLTMMARLVEALRDDARLVLVGDADQLPPVQAGAVLSDIVAGYATHQSSPVARLATTHRYGEHIGALAEAVRAGDADRAVEVLRAGVSEVVFVEDDDPVPTLRPVVVGQAMAVRHAAAQGAADDALAALGRHRLLCAHREGPRGVRVWNQQIDRWLAAESGDPMYEPMYVGRPLLVTTNDYALGLFNGDSGVVLASDGDRRDAVFATAAGPVRLSTHRLHDVQTMHALTVHKSQGSQAEEVTVLLPGPESPLLSRELLYTALTRASRRVRVVGSEATVRAAVARRVQRATGLRHRLVQADPGPGAAGD